MNDRASPDYHAMVSPILLECLARKTLLELRPATAPRQNSDDTVYVLRRDGSRPFKLRGKLIAAATKGFDAMCDLYQQHLNLYIGTHQELVAHLILEPTNKETTRPMFRVVPVQNDTDLTELSAQLYTPCDAVASETSTGNEGIS